MEKKYFTKKLGSMILIFAFIVQLIAPGSVYAAEKDSQWEEHVIHSAKELPQSIEEGTRWKLESDICLEPGQQIENINGIFDGQGHTITLADKPLAKEVSGVVQNLGVTGKLKNPGNSYGSIATTLNKGTVQNCFSTVDFDLQWNSDGGLVGDSKGGKIYNSYFAGTATETFGVVDLGGIVGCSNTAGQPSVIKNCYYTIGYPTPVNLGSEYNKEDTSCKKISVDELKATAVVDLLNKEIPDTGYIWRREEGSFPILVKQEKKEDTTESKKTDKTALNKKIDEADKLEEPFYTKDTWGNFWTILQQAQKVAADPNADQKKINDVLKKLSESMEKLEKNPVLTAVAMPENSEKLVKVTDASQLKNTEPGKYYQLQNNIFTDGSTESFHGILDGNGYTITLKGKALFRSVEEDAIIQNVHFEGAVGENEGPLGRILKGTIVNSSSFITGKASAGFVKRIKDGVISNCISYGRPESGSLFQVYANTDWENGGEYRGKIYSSYWLETPNDPVINKEDLKDGSGNVKDTQMKSKKMVELLNSKTGKNGTKWGQNPKTGFPYFGSDGAYNPDEGNLPDNSYHVKFGKNLNQAELIKDQKLNVSSDDLTAKDNHVIGTFYLDGAEQEEVTWSVEDVTNEAFAISLKDGRLYLYGDGEGIVKAQVNGEDAAWIKVVSQSKEIKDFEIYIQDSVNKNGVKSEKNNPYIMNGSDWGNICVKALYEGEKEYKPVYSQKFKYEYGENIHHGEGTEFYFEKPTMSSVTVSLKKNPDLKKTIQLGSKFIPIESITPSIEGRNILHSRASMMSGKQFDAIENSGVIIQPSNASNAKSKDFTVTSNHPEIAKFSPTLPVGYLPFSAGEVTFTAEIKDKDLLHNYEKIVSGNSKVTFEYKNPLASIQIPQNAFEIKAGEKIPLDLKFEGEHSKEGWKVTEPGIKWTFDKEGIVSIGRESLAVQNREEGTLDAGSWIASTDYEIKGLKEGTVKVTGKPVDQTNTVGPVEFTVTVNKGEENLTDISTLVKKGKDASIHYIEEKHKKKEYSFGDEWEVYALLRAGRKISREQLDEYYNNVLEVIEKWNKRSKPTDLERIALALSAMGKNIENVNGKNLAQLIYNHPNLDSGSNELCFALIALDSRNTKIPENARWTRTKIVEELLSWQNEDGGFPLLKNGSSGIDTTAMVLQAFENYKEDSRVEKAIKDALLYLKTCIVPDLDAKTAEANAQILLTLTSLGIDPLADKNFSTETANLIVSLMDYYIDQDGNKGFVHTKSQKKINTMATVQALQALDSYENFEKGEDTYWNTVSLVKEKNPDVSEKDKDDLEVQKVIEKIHKIPSEITLDSEKIILNARKAYDKLSAKQKKMIPDSDVLKLTVAETQLELLKKQEAENPASDKVVVSVERFTLGQGYYIEPKYVPYRKGDTGMDLLKKAIGKDHFVGYTGYLQAIKGADLGSDSVQVPEYISKLGPDAPDTKKTKEYYERKGKEYFSPGILGEKTYHEHSGWFYSVNGKFSESGMEEYVPQPGDVMRVQYTLYGYGTDLSGKNKKDETLAEISDKTELTKVLADVNRNKENYLTDPLVKQLYGEAMTIVQNMTEDQKQVDRICKELKTAIQNANVPKPEEEVVLEKEEFGISLTTKNIPEDSQLEVRLLNAKDKEVTIMRNETLVSKALFRLIKVGISKDGKEISLSDSANLRIPVGKKYNGQTLRVLHCKDKKLEQETSKVVNGFVTVRVSELGSFGVAVDASTIKELDDLESEKNETNFQEKGKNEKAAKTGDQSQVPVLAVLFAGSVFIGISEFKKRKKRG